MKTKYTVTPFHPCNDLDRAKGTVAGWDVRDENNVAVECFDHEDEARARCAELNAAPVKATRMSAMNDDETLPEIPEGYRQLDCMELLQKDDMIFGQYQETWFPVRADSPFISCSAGNTRIVVRKADRQADPEVLALRRATTKTHGQ
jgi:hypothetical protein